MIQMLLNALLLALRAIRRNLMRSFLTVLGVVIGVAAVITMVTLGNGATRMVSDQISSLGSNLLILRPGQYSFGDFLRVGLPLTVLIALVSAWMARWLWMGGPLLPSFA